MLSLEKRRRVRSVASLQRCIPQLFSNLRFFPFADRGSPEVKAWAHDRDAVWVGPGPVGFPLLRPHALRLPLAHSHWAYSPAPSQASVSLYPASLMTGSPSCLSQGGPRSCQSGACCLMRSDWPFLPNRHQSLLWVTKPALWRREMRMKCAKQGRERVFLRDIARTAFLSRKSTKATHTLNLCHAYPSPRLTSPLLFLSPFPCATAVRRHFSGRDPPPRRRPPAGAPPHC